ncbi:DUF2484 family protein [Celeribacter neptunius]|uniref:UDP-N-acetylmuramate--alanine ligase n=1 Tax=Celeribacter neptunius TaxID=588602 RepID=A0A1I3P8Y6_9RHOB|nr:DUF2484 family protein [Celeribacter neptunius]SFJ17963.1 Protein of unknown function [Celeribacter neptunius]
MSALLSPLVALAIWALATMALAPLPIRYQILPGLALLLALPVILIWVGRSYGPWPVLVGCVAAVSLFRKPLGALWRRLTRGIRKG